MVSHTGHNSRLAQLHNCNPTLLEMKEGRSGGKLWMRYLSLPETLDDGQLTQCKQILDEAIGEWMKRPTVYSPSSDAPTDRPFRMPQAEIARYVDLLKAPTLLSGNFGDREELQQHMNRVAKVDRLPQHNSTEALFVLRNVSGTRARSRRGRNRV